MKKTTLLIAMIAILTTFFACKNSANKPNENAADSTDMHTSQNSIDWAGTYYGVVPCASCPGINTFITLNSDGTFESMIEYIESDDTLEITKGNFVWEDNKNNIIIGENIYKVGENKLFMLDANKNVIEGELANNYILEKVELQPAIDANEGYNLVVFVDKNKNEYNIVFNTNPEIPTALVYNADMKRMLTQKEAWAKGAEYEGAYTKLHVNGEKATLTINKNKIELTEKVN